jgi:predicted site-specific integrase-resolvase
MLPKDAITVAQAAKRKRVSVSAIQSWIRRGWIKSTKVNPRMAFVSWGEVEKFTPPPVGRRKKEK